MFETVHVVLAEPRPTLTVPEANEFAPLVCVAEKSAMVTPTPSADTAARASAIDPRVDVNLVFLVVMCFPFCWGSCVRR
jgi:hypothetical protein